MSTQTKTIKYIETSKLSGNVLCDVGNRWRYKQVKNPAKEAMLFDTEQEAYNARHEYRRRYHEIIYPYYPAEYEIIAIEV